MLTIFFSKITPSFGRRLVARKRGPRRRNLVLRKGRQLWNTPRVEAFTWINYNYLNYDYCTIVPWLRSGERGPRTWCHWRSCEQISSWSKGCNIISIWVGSMFIWPEGLWSPLGRGAQHARKGFPLPLYFKVGQFCSLYYNILHFIRDFL